MRQFFTGIFLAICIPVLQAGGYRLAEVDALLVADTEPEGVVFEIVTWGDNTWDWAAPMLSALTQQLRAKYPGLEIALV